MKTIKGRNKEASLLTLRRKQGAVTSSSAWGSPSSFLGSPEQEGGVAKGPC